MAHRDKNNSSEYTDDLRASIWKDVKEDRARLLHDIEQHDSSSPGNQNGDHFNGDFNLDTLRSRSTVLREDGHASRYENHAKPNRTTAQLSRGGATYRIDSSEVLNNSRSRTGSHSSSSGNISDVRQINRTSDPSKVVFNALSPVSGNRSDRAKNGATSGRISGEGQKHKMADASTTVPDTPRTKQLKDLRAKRLQYFEKQFQESTINQGTEKSQKRSPRKMTLKDVSPRKIDSMATKDINLDFTVLKEKQGNTDAASFKGHSPGTPAGSKPQGLKSQPLKQGNYERVDNVTSLASGHEHQRDFTVVNSVEDVLRSEDDKFRHSVDPVVDLLGLQKALKDGDEGLRRYLQEMGRQGQASQSSHLLDKRTINKTSKGNMKNQSRNSPRGHLYRSPAGGMNQVQNSGRNGSVSPKNKKSLKSGKENNEKHFPVTQNKWEERIFQETQTTKTPPKLSKDSNLPDRRSKIESPFVTSNELENLGLYEDLFMGHREDDRLNNQVRNRNSSLVKSNPDFKRNYESNNLQTSVYLTEVAEDELDVVNGPVKNQKQLIEGHENSSDSEDELDVVNGPVKNQKQLIEGHENSSDSDPADETANSRYHKVQNKWKSAVATESDRENKSDVELETHRPDVRPISPLKDVKLNFKIAKNHQPPASDWDITNVGSSMVSPRLPTPKKPAGVPKLLLQPSSSEEESDHLEFMDFPKKRQKRKKEKPSEADDQSDFTMITELAPGKIKVGKQKQRVMKTDLTLTLSLDSTVSGGSEYPDPEMMSDLKGSNVKQDPQGQPHATVDGDQLSHKYSSTAKARVKKPHTVDTEPLSKLSHSVNTSDSSKASTYKQLPRKSPDLIKTAEEHAEQNKKLRRSKNDLMNEMYDDWIDTHSKQATHNVFISEKLDDVLSPRTDYFNHTAGSEQVLKGKPTGRSGVSVEDFLTGIPYGKSNEDKKRDSQDQSGKGETTTIKPFARAEMILGARSKSQSDGTDEVRKGHVETYKLLEKNFSDVEKKLAELGLEHLLDESNDFSQAADMKIQMIKMCPECDAVNREHITWCLECGCVLIGVQAEPHPDAVKAIASNYTNESGDVQLHDIPELNKNNENSGKEERSSDSKVPQERPPPTSETHPQILPVLSEGCHRIHTSNSDLPSSSDPVVQRNAVERPLTAYEQYLLHLEREKQQQLNLQQQDISAIVPETKNVSFAPSSSLAQSERPVENLDFSSNEDVSDGSVREGEIGQNVSALLESPARPENTVSVVSDSSDVPDDEPHPLFAKFLSDPRIRPGETLNDERFQAGGASPSAASRPRPSSADPKRTVREKTQTRPSSSGTKSRTRQYIEQEFYQRHWARSSTGWGSYKENELSTWSSVDASKKSSQKQRPVSGKKSSRTATENNTEHSKSARPVSASKPRSSNTPENFNNNNSTKKPRPTSAKTKQKNEKRSDFETSSRPRSSRSQRTAEGQDNYFQVNVAQLSESTSRPLNSYGASNVPPLTLKLLLESPRDARSLSIWQLLPDEIILEIFSFLSHKDLVRCAQVCHLFDRLARDETLWRQIILEKKSLCDDWLEEIGKKCPTTLSLEQCRGARVSSVGLRSLFRACSASLEELNVSGCSQGELTGDSILLHATRCPNLSVIDASWCNVSDNAVIALVDSSQRLESVCLNGCQAITDEAVCALVEKHANSLEVLELFGCFNLTPTSILMAGSFCKNLRTLNIGQCYKLTDDSISQLATHLKNVECLDLRGCKQIKDDCVRKVVRKCPRLQSLVLANCPLITDQALVEIATYLSSIKSLDVSGCKKITNTGVSSIAMSCPHLVHLDISSTGINHRSVSAIASYCNKHLETLKLSFCSDITEASIIKLAGNCKNLQSLHLFGCKGVRNLHYLNAINPFMKVKTDVAIGRTFNNWDFTIYRQSHML